MYFLRKELFIFSFFQKRNFLHAFFEESERSLCFDQRNQIFESTATTLTLFQSCVFYLLLLIFVTLQAKTVTENKRYTA